MVPFDSHFYRGGGRLCGDLGLVMAPDTRAGQGDLISFAVPLRHANGTAASVLDGRNGLSDPLRGCTDIPYLRQRVLRRA